MFNPWYIAVHTNMPSRIGPTITIPSGSRPSQATRSVPRTVIEVGLLIASRAE